MTSARTATHKRDTRETKINIDLNIDGSGHYDIQTGIGFFDHMLETFSIHGAFDLTLHIDGDLHIDQHHSIEDAGIALGTCFAEALRDKRGITRVGSCYFPLDEALTRTVVDISGRPSLAYNVNFKNETLGNPENNSQLQTECVREFFQGFVNAMKITVHIDTLKAENEHHKIETIFKSFARALRYAVAIDPKLRDQIPSAKGTL